MAGRQSRGRQRIPIRLIESQEDLYATFSKRRLGIYKKASELSTLCGVDTGVIIFSPTDNPYSFFHPTMETVLDKYITNPNPNPNNDARIVESQTRLRIEELSRRLDELVEERDDDKKVLEEMVEIRNSVHGEKGWWEGPVESLNKEQKKEWAAWLQAVKAQIESRLKVHGAPGPSTPAVPYHYGVPDQYWWGLQGAGVGTTYAFPHYPLNASTTNQRWQGGGI